MVTHRPEHGTSNHSIDHHRDGKPYHWKNHSIDNAPATGTKQRQGIERCQDDNENKVHRNKLYDKVVSGTTGDLDLHTAAMHHKTYFNWERIRRR